MKIKAKRHQIIQSLNSSNKNNQQLKTMTDLLLLVQLRHESINEPTKLKRNTAGNSLKTT